MLWKDADPDPDIPSQKEAKAEPSFRARNRPRQASHVPCALMQRTCVAKSTHRVSALNSVTPSGACLPANRMISTTMLSFERKNCQCISPGSWNRQQWADAAILKLATASAKSRIVSIGV
jgi:hypothetical protein